MKTPNENKMGVMPITKLLINMAVPMMLSMLMQALYNVVDSIYVSRVSEASLTAVSLCFPAQNLMIGVATGLGVGFNALLSRALGAGDRKKGNEISVNGLFLEACGFVLFLLFGLTLCRRFMAAQTAVEEIIQYGTDYLMIVCCCSFGLFGQIACERLLQATGRTFHSMCTQMLGAVINIVLDPVFIFTFGMGVKGAAVATVIGQIIGFIAGILLNATKNTDVTISFKGFRPNGKIIGNILAIGVPSIIMVGIGSVMTFCMNKILIAYTTAKETTATVFGVYFKLNSFVCMPIFGMNNAVTSIVAYNYGAQNRKRMMSTIKQGTLIAVVYMFLGMLAFEIIPGKLLQMFDAAETMLTVGIPALRIIGTTFVFAAICIALGASFQALGYGTYSMVVSLARQLLVLIPSAYLLARAGLASGNEHLVWYSFPIAEIASLTVTALLFIKLYKKVIAPVPDGAPVK